jgi:hypothetical protein
LAGSNLKSKILQLYNRIVNDTIYVYNSTGELWASDNSSANAPKIAEKTYLNQIFWITETIPASTDVNETLYRLVWSGINDKELLEYSSDLETKWNITLNHIFSSNFTVYNITAFTNYSTYNVSDNMNFTAIKMQDEIQTDVTSELIIDISSKIITLPIVDISFNKDVFFIITAKDLNPPSINLTFPLNNTVTNIQSQTFQCDITDLISISNITFYIWNSTELLYSETAELSGTLNSTNFTYSLLNEGQYEWNCLGYDLSGNSNWSAHGNHTIILNQQPPIITIYSPINITYNSKNVSINFTADYYEALWFNNGTENISYTFHHILKQWKDIIQLFYGQMIQADS